MSPNPIAVGQIEADLASARERVADLESLLRMARKVYGTTAPEEAPSPSRRDEPDSPLAGLTTAQAAVRTLREADGPMSMPDLADRMLQAGWRTKATHPVDTIKTALSRDTVPVVRVARGLYGFKAPTTNGQAAEEVREDPGSNPGIHPPS